MLITEGWDQIEFHEAIVKSITEKNRDIIFELNSVVMLNNHPFNTIKQTVVLHACKLSFSHVKNIKVRAYRSSAGTWTDCERPYPHMTEIAETRVKLGSWSIAGFDGTGLWLEWTLEEFESVKLESH